MQRKPAAGQSRVTAATCPRLDLDSAQPVGLGLMRNSMAYSVGTMTGVSTVAKVSPAMMVIDMFTKNTSFSNGIRPSTVVVAAGTTGR